MKNSDLVIVGAGINGLVAANDLQRSGCNEPAGIDRDQKELDRELGNSCCVMHSLARDIVRGAIDKKQRPQARVI